MRIIAFILTFEGFIPEVLSSKRWLLGGMPKVADFPSPLCEYLRMDGEKQMMFWRRQEAKHNTNKRLAKGRAFKRLSL
jgi:hypothetical protein